jgi:hypothetical protein
MNGTRVALLWRVGPAMRAFLRRRDLDPFDAIDVAQNLLVVLVPDLFGDAVGWGGEVASPFVTRDDPRRRLLRRGVVTGDRAARRVDGQEGPASDVGDPVNVTRVGMREFLADAE